MTVSSSRLVSSTVNVILTVISAYGDTNLFCTCPPVEDTVDDA